MADDDSGGVWDRVKGWAAALPQIPDPGEMLAGEIGRTAGAVKQFASQTPQEQLGQVWQGAKSALANPPDPWRSWEEGRPLEAMLAGPQTGMLKGFYSPAAKAAATLPAKGSPEQLLATLRNRNIPGFGQEEQWSGAGQAFAGRPSITREELARHFEKGMPDLQETVLSRNATKDIDAKIDALHERQDLSEPEWNAEYKALMDQRDAVFNPPRYADYTLPGGQNYRELLMHLPEYGAGEEWPKPGDTRVNYRSSHWDTPNVVGHLRMSDRPLPGGGKALHLEELQSDWGQEGRGQEDVPEGPYVGKTQHWVDLGLKRALQEAAQGGYDRLLITPGEEQVKRFDLSHKIDKLVYDPKEWMLEAYDPEGYNVFEKAVHKSKIQDYVGKEVANKLLATEPGEMGGKHLLQGQDLTIGGEGMKSFYDKMVPSHLNKLLAKIDKNAKVEPYQLPGKPMPATFQPEKRAFQAIPDAEWNAMTPEQRRARSEEHRQQEWAKANAGPTVHSVPISAAMREKIMNEGFPAYATGGRIARQEGGVTDPVLPIPTRLPTQEDLSRVWETAKGLLTPPDPYAEAGRAVEQYRAGHPVEAFTTMASAIPETGALRRAKGAEKIASPPVVGKAVGFDPAELATRYPQRVPGEIMADPRTGKEYLGKVMSPEAEAVMKQRALAQKDILAGRYDPYFDVSKRFYVDPKFYPLEGETITEAAPKKAETMQQWMERYNNPETRKRLTAAVQSAQGDPNAWHWYAMGQLEKKYTDALGKKAGREAFKQDFAQGMAATTGGMDPTSNYLMTHYANVMRALGEPLPTAAHELHSPIGGRYATGNLAQYQKMIGEGAGIQAAANPKRFNFASNFMGYRDRPTIDEQMMELIHPKAEGGKGLPQWYAPAEQSVVDVAKNLKMDPVNAQELAWFGTKGVAGKPMMQIINEAIERTRRVTGMDPEDIVTQNIVRKQGPVYATGGAIDPVWGAMRIANERAEP